MRIEYDASAWTGRILWAISRPSHLCRLVVGTLGPVWAVSRGHDAPLAAATSRARVRPDHGSSVRATSRARVREIFSSTARILSIVSGDPSLASQPTRVDATEVSTFELEPDAPRRGDEIGHFTILDRLGAGGMGIVYAAYDVELNRKVAIKLLRVAPGQDQSIGRARLMREAQAMAKVDHANVVTVFEVGKHCGDVYIAMEFIDGDTFGGWRARTRAGWREVIDVLGLAARGLAAAHAQGLVHRDFKPDNVMVGRDGRVRVMDFGLVRSDAEPGSTSHCEPQTGSNIDAPDTSLGDPGLTKVGSMVGTPAYMAPEQFTREPTDARTDQFSFCVTLWEALFGERPFEGDSILTLGMHVTEGIRKPTPKSSSVPSWLLRVCERGLSTDPAARYESMRALLGAVESGRRRSKRRWMALAATTLAVGASAVWVGGVVAQRRGIQACEAAGNEIDEVWNDAARSRLRDAFEPLGEEASSRPLASASRLLDDMSGSWSGARTEACLRARVRGEWAQDVHERALWCLDEQRRTLGATLEAVADTRERAVLLQFVPALSELGGVDDCLEEDALRVRTLPPSSARSRVVELRDELASLDALLLTAQFGKAVEASEAVVARPDAGMWAPLHAELLLRLGRALAARGDLDVAESHLEDGYLEAVESQRSDIASAVALELANVLGSRLNEPERGMLWMRLAEVHERARRQTPLRRAGHLHRRSSLLKELERFDESEAGYLKALTLFEEELGSDHLLIARTRSNLGNLYQELSRFDEAMTQYEVALAIRRETLGEAHPDVAQTLVGMANTRGSMGAYEEALALHQRALGIFEDALGDEHVLVALSLGTLAGAHIDMGQLGPALDHATRSAKIYEAQLGALHAKTANAQNAIGTIHHRAGRLDEAKVHYERARLGLEATTGPVNAEVANVLFNLALIERQAGATERSRSLFLRALDIRETVYGDSHVAVADSLEELAILEATDGHPDAARPMFERVLTIRRELQGVGHARVWDAVSNLAALDEMTGEPQRTRELYAEVSADWSETLGNDDPALALPLLAAAQLELREGRPAAAVALARRAVVLRSEEGQDPVDLAQAQFTLARATSPNPRDETETESLELAREALKALAGSPERAGLRAEIQAWLAERGDAG